MKEVKNMEIGCKTLWIGDETTVYPLDKYMNCRAPQTGMIVKLIETTDFGFCVLQQSDGNHLYKIG